MPNRPIAPELSPELEWVNTQGPLTLQAYRGKVVLLYFWGISQVNSQHALLDVRYLENNTTMAWWSWVSAARNSPRSARLRVC